MIVPSPAQRPRPLRRTLPHQQSVKPPGINSRTCEHGVKLPACLHSGMALSMKGKAVLAVCFTVAALTLFWPGEQIPHDLKVIVQKVGCPLVRQMESWFMYELQHPCHRCPPRPERENTITVSASLQGYGPDFEGVLPEDHPPVMTTGSAASMPGVTAAGAASSVPGVRTRMLTLYHNGTIWTADPEVSESMCTDKCLLGQGACKCQVTVRPE